MSEVYVQVLYDFKYYTEEGNEVKIKAGEELLLLKKSNENWWQVIRNSGESPFYAPSNYLSVIGLNCKETIESVDVNSNFTEDNQKTDNLKMTVKPKFSHHSFKNFTEEGKPRNYDKQKLGKDCFAFKNPLCTDDFITCSNNHEDREKNVPLINELNVGKSSDVFNSKNHDKTTDGVSKIFYLV